MSEKTRLHALDSIRGITLLSMIAYHAMWDLVYMFGVHAPWYRSDGAHLWQQSICWTFILLSGFCHSLGRKPLRRGGIVLLASVVISAVTMILMPEQRVLFGVLTLLGCSMLLMIPVGGLCRRFVSPYIGAAVSFAVFLLTKTVQTGVLTVFGKTLLVLPETLYANNLTAFFGFPGPDFYSTDYFPLTPWFFLYLCGWFGYEIFHSRGWLSVFSGPRVPGLAFLGRHSLVIYMLHQPLIYAVLYAVFALLS